MAVPLLNLGAVRQTLRSASGFTLIDMVVTLTLISIISAMAIPVIKDFGDAVALGQAQRMVASELQQARMMSVTTNRVIRVRFNCPANKQFRMVELIGTSSIPSTADTAANRCNSINYPYPAGDNNPVTLPNHDGPVRQVDTRVSFGDVQTIEFRPTGMAYSVNADGTASLPLAGNGIALTVTKGQDVKTVTVNALGKITAQ
jgi:Tfp pilus assembly protein FimT